MSSMDFHPIPIRTAGGDSYSPFCLDEEKIVRLVRQPEQADRDDVLHAIRCERCSQLVHETREKFAALQLAIPHEHDAPRWAYRSARAAMIVLAIGVGTLGVGKIAATITARNFDSDGVSYTAWAPNPHGVQPVGSRNGLLEVCVPIDELSAIDKTFLDRALDGIGDETVVVMARDGTTATIRRGTTSSGGSVAKHAQEEYGDLSMQLALLAFNDLSDADPGNLPPNTPMWFPQRDLLQAWASLHPIEVLRAERAIRRKLSPPMM